MKHRKSIKWITLFLVLMLIFCTGCTGNSADNDSAANGSEASGDLEWPTEPITMIVTYTPGGSADNIARVVSPFLSEKLGVPIHIENTPPPQVGENLFSRTEPDGYTIGTMSPGSVSSNNVFNDLPYDGRDFEWISSFVVSSSYIFVSTTGGVNSVDDLRNISQERPIKIAATSKFLGSSSALALVFEYLELDYTFITGYESGGDVLSALIRNEVDVVGTSLGSGSAFVRSGDIKALVALQPERTEEMPEVTSLQELGYEGSARVLGKSTFALVAPPETDSQILDKIETALAEICENQDFIDQAFNNGFFVEITPRSEIGDLIEAIYNAYYEAKPILEASN